MTQVLITIDTELSIRAHKAGAGLAENLSESILGATAAGAFGVGWQAGRLRAAGLTGVFFIDPMPCALFGTDWLARVVALVLEGGHEAQLHCHPGWRRYCPQTADWRAWRSDDIGSYPLGVQLELLERARDWLVAAGAPPPRAFRAGNYGADDQTLAALARLGIAYDSSFNPAVPGARIALPAGQVAATERHGVIELPVGAIEEAPGRLRLAQINALSAAELGAALDHAARAGVGQFSIVTHSFEMLNRARTRPNRTVVARFEALLAHLAANRQRLPVVGYADLDVARAARGASRLPPSAPRRLARLAGQAWANWRYEAA